MTAVPSARRRPWVVGISGASGTGYAASVLRGLLDAGEDVDLIVSRAARMTLRDETGMVFRPSRWREDMEAWVERDLAAVRHWAIDDMAAGPSSGSYRTKGMIVVPATTASVAGIAAGISKDLLQRAGDVTLKERRPLVLVLRETPLRRATLLQLADLSAEGAIVLPASPGFYAGARSAQALINFVAGKVLDVVGVDHQLFEPWDGQLSKPAGGVGRDPDDGHELLEEL